MQTCVAAMKTTQLYLSRGLMLISGKQGQRQPSAQDANSSVVSIINKGSSPNLNTYKTSP